MANKFLKFLQDVNNILDEKEKNEEKQRLNKLEKEMGMYGLDENEKELVRRGEYNLWDFDPDNPHEDDDYYKDDLDYDDDDE